MIQSLIVAPVLIATLAVSAAWPSAAMGAEGRAPSQVSARGPDVLTITGSLSYRPRIALTPDSTAIAALRAGSAPDAPLLAEQRIELEGRQVPIPFTLTVDREAITTSSPVLRGAIRSAERVHWLTEPIAIDAAAESIDLGMLMMTAHEPLAFASTLYCGDQVIRVGHDGDELILEVADETWRMRPVRAASGARYEAIDDPSTTFWSKGERALLEIRGEPYPECGPLPVPETLTATGNEPGWRLEIGADEISVSARYGEITFTAPRPEPEVTQEAVRYRVQGQGHDLTITVRDQLCADTMTGMPHPLSVTLELDGETLQGCGGDPVALLQGDEWRVEDLDGRGIIDRSEITMTFDADGSLTGKGSCNRYGSSYELTGEGLKIGLGMSTMMACGEALDRQERRFMDILAAVQRFEIDPSGALILHTADGRTLTARR